MKPVLVRDLALERWPSMDRYAEALAERVPDALVPDAWRMRGPRYLVRYWSYPRALRRFKGDLVHVLDHSYAHCLAAFQGLPSAVTVHDLYPLRVLTEAGRGIRGRVRDALLRHVLKWLQRADRLVVSTRWAAGEVERCLGFAAERIHVIPYGVDGRFFEAPAPDAVRARREEWLARLEAGRGAPAILLHVGSCAARKNVEAALEALALLRERGVAAVLVQLGGVFSAAQRRLIGRRRLASAVLQEPSVAEHVLVAAYYAADVLLLPSSFEGFGLPALEAMAAGLPVVSSGAGGLREATADAAVVTGALGGEAFAGAAAALLADPAMRADLVRRGRERARSLSWDRTVAATLEVYDRLLRS